MPGSFLRKWRLYSTERNTKFGEQDGACLWVLGGVSSNRENFRIDQFLLGYCRDGLVHKGREDSGVKNLNIRVQTLLLDGWSLNDVGKFEDCLLLLSTP